MNRTTLVALVIVGVAVAAGCSRRQQEWETARRADTVEAYEQFLRSFPDGEFTSQAQARARELQEAGDWEKALRADTAEAYREFLERHPQGRLADEARIRMTNFALAPAPAQPASQQTPSVSESPTPGAPGSAPAPAGGAYRIQLGAFSGGDKQAMGEWRRLQSEYPQVLNGLTPSVKLATTQAGHLYRLQAGVMSEARARDACTRLKIRGQACVVVPP